MSLKLLNTTGLAFMLFVSFSCKKKQIVVGEEEPVEVKATCSITSNGRSEGIRYDFIYDEATMVNINGFNDFDTFIYEGGVLRKGINSRDKSYSVTFFYDAKKLLNKVVFDGKDGQNKPFSHATTLTYNASNRIESMKLGLPTFDDMVDTRFNYDAKGNLQTLSAYLDGQWQTVLENTAFDEKSAPYKNQQIGQVLSYFMVYSVLTGGNNLSYFLNQNNVKTARMKSGNTTIALSYTYQYNEYGYPVKSEITRTVNNKITSLSEYFTYLCKK